MSTSLRQFLFQQNWALWKRLVGLIRLQQQVPQWLPIVGVLVAQLPTSTVQNVYWSSTSFATSTYLQDYVI